MKILSQDPAQETLKLWFLTNAASAAEVIQPGPDGGVVLPSSGQLLLSSLSILPPSAVGRLLASGVEVVTCDGIDTRASSGVGPLQRQVIQRVLGSFAGWLTAKEPQRAGGADLTAEVERLQAANADLVMRCAALQEELAVLKAPPLGPPPADFDEVPKKKAKKEPAAA